MRVAGAIVLGAIAGLLAIVLVLTVDAERMLLDTDAWTDSTAVVLEDEEARSALASLLVGRGMDRLTCRSAVASFVANGPVGERIGARMYVEVERVLSSDRAGSLWRTTNAAAHAAFVRAARADRAVGDDRLLDLGSMFDRAARVADLLDISEGDDADAGAGADDACGGSADDGVAVLDADALRTAGDAAAMLHDARRVPGYLTIAIGVTLVLMALIAGTVLRLGIGLVSAGTAALAAAFFARDYITTDGVPLLVDGIRDPLVHTLAQATVKAALAPTTHHLTWFAIGAGALVVVGGLLVVVGTIRRTRRS